jgi:acyl carrier protein
MTAPWGGDRLSVLAVWTTRPLPLPVLTARERAYAATLGPGLRHWLTSRNAQRLLLGLLGMECETTAYTYPHRRLSLSHTETGSLAAGVRTPVPAGMAGLGADLEPDHAADPRTARFFLDERERRWLTGLSPKAGGSEHVRLWTVKEALFKADPANSGATLRDYLVDEPEARCGQARRRRHDTIFGYASGRLGGAHLSVAASFRPTHTRTHHAPRRNMGIETIGFAQVAEKIGATLSIPAAALTPDTRLNELAVESFRMVEMVIDLQEEFDAVFSQMQLREVDTIGQLVELIRSTRS